MATQEQIFAAAQALCLFGCNLGNPGAYEEAARLALNAAEKTSRIEEKQDSGRNES